MKLCRKCGRELPLSDFPKDGYSPCSSCRSLRSSIWHVQDQKKHPEKYRAMAKRFRINNPGYSGRKTKPKYNPKASAKAKKRYFNKPGNRDKQRAYCREYYAANRERILKQKKKASLTKVTHS